MIEKALNKIGIKRLPPILYPLGLPIYLVIVIVNFLIGVCKWTYYIVFWLLGFWNCVVCKKLYWINSDRLCIDKEKTISLFDDHICDACRVAHELAKKEKEQEEDRYENGLLDGYWFGG